MNRFCCFDNSFRSEKLPKHVLEIPHENILVHNFVQIAQSDAEEDGPGRFKFLRHSVRISACRDMAYRPTAESVISMRVLTSSVRYRNLSGSSICFAMCMKGSAANKASIIMYSIALAVKFGQSGARNRGRVPYRSCDYRYACEG